MTYAGLTISDKPALMDAKSAGFKWIARDEDGEIDAYEHAPHKNTEYDNYWSAVGDYLTINETLLQFIQWSDDEPVNIDLALAQIAEMESAEKPQEEMTIHGYSIRHLELIAILMRDHGVTPEDVKEAARNYSSGAMFAFEAANEQIQKGFKDAVERIGSPYTEGETK